jgi:hypothetical protein
MGENKLREYRVYKKRADGRSIGLPDVIACASDKEAIAQARRRITDHSVEIWEGRRRVASLDPSDAPNRPD